MQAEETEGWPRGDRQKGPRPGALLPRHPAVLHARPLGPLILAMLGSTRLYEEAVRYISVRR
jgi:hypothetical protein